MQVTVDLVPYDVTVVPSPAGTIIQPTYIIKNFLGMDGINSLKRKNPYNEPSGIIMHLPVLVTVSESELEFCADSEEKFLAALDYLLDAYKSVGWECLDN